MNREQNMTIGSPIKLIITFMIPLVLANLGQQLYMIVDAIIVGQKVGVEALAAVGATDWPYWLVLWIILALCQGFAIPIAQYFGINDKLQVKKAIAKTIQLCLGLAILLTILFLAVATPLLQALQTPDDVFSGASTYLHIMYGGIIIVMAYNMASSILRAIGDGKTPLIAILIAGITNVALDLLFVLQFNWGIAGAAIATVTAQFLAFCYCFRVLWKMQLISWEHEIWEKDFSLIKKLCSLGFPLALQHVLIAVGGMIFQSAINQQGFIFIAGFTATNKIYGLLESSAISLGYAMTTYVAQNYGAGLYGRIRQGVKQSIIIAIGLSVLISLTMIIAGKPILSLFIDAKNENYFQVLEIAYQYLFVMSCFLSSLYLLNVFRNILQGLSNTLASFLSGVMEFFTRVFVALVLVNYFDSDILFLGEPGAWIMAMLILIIMGIKRIKALPK